MGPEYQRQLDDLFRKIEQLEAVVQFQQQTIESQQQIIEAQQRTIEAQQARIKELESALAAAESALAAAKKNSSNSSKPPSSDIVKPKKNGADKDANGDANNNDSASGQRKRGGQKGHPGHFRPEFTADQIDEVFEYTLTHCPSCGTQLEDGKRAPSVIQQVKIIKKPIKIEEHRGLPYWCPVCKCVHYAPMPKEVEHGGLFDAKLTAIVAYMKGVCHASYSTIRKFLRDVIGVRVSRGHLKNILAKVSNSLEAVYNELGTILPQQNAAHIDESSLPENGKKLWIWAFETKLFSFYKIDPSRGSQVLIETLGKNFRGVIGCDYFSAYRKYMRDFNVVVQFCLAHLIRDIKFLCDQKDAATKSYGEGLRELMRELFAIIHLHDSMDASVFTALLQAKQSLILAAATTNVPTTREAQNLAKRFTTHGESFFTFITNPEIEPTNNIAERAIRFVTIDRRVTQGVRSEWGRRFMERLWTVLSTCEKQSRDVLNFLEECLLSFWHDKSPPTLAAAVE
jgi:transposase